LRGKIALGDRRFEGLDGAEQMLIIALYHGDLPGKHLQVSFQVRAK
jgi:hypothetical protein